MADRFDEGMVLTWSGRWHWPLTDRPPRRHEPAVQTLCGAQGYSDRNALGSYDWLHKFADDPNTPVCKRCVAAKKKAGD